MISVIFLPKYRHVLYTFLNLFLFEEPVCAQCKFLLYKNTKRAMSPSAPLSDWNFRSAQSAWCMLITTNLSDRVAILFLLGPEEALNESRDPVLQRARDSGGWLSAWKMIKSVVWLSLFSSWYVNKKDALILKNAIKVCQGISWV